MKHGVLVILELQKMVQHNMDLLAVHHTQTVMKLGFLVNLDMFDLEVRHQLAGVVNGTDHLQGVVVRNVIQINIKKKLFLSHCYTKIDLFCNLFTAKSGKI